MRVLVTGGSGFIGSGLVRALCAAGYLVRVVSRKNKLKVNYRSDSIQVVQIDLLDPDCSLEEAVAGCSVVVNCVGELQNENHMVALHVDATRKLISACKREATVTGQPLHLVQLSSVGAYGPNRNGASSVRVVTEESVPAPEGIYETTKTQADELVTAAAEHDVLTYSILRPSNVYGARMPNGSLRQWGKVIERRLFFYVGVPGAISTYVHVNDVVDALMLCCFDERARGQIFNISNDCFQESLVSAMAKALDVPEPTLRVPEAPMRLVAKLFSVVRGFPMTTSRIDSLVAQTSYPTDKLRSVLGYSPRHDVNETIGEIFLHNGDAS